MIRRRTGTSIRLLAVALIAIMAIMAIAPIFTVAAQDKQTATVGVAFTLTGNNAVYGESQKKGAELAAEEINASGYIPGVDLKLQIEDDGGDPENGVPVFQKFISDDSVVAIIGPTLSNTAKTTDPLAQEANVPVLAVSNTSGHRGVNEITCS